MVLKDINLKIPKGEVTAIVGTSGSGKTTIGKKLANLLQLPFFDADDFHPISNIKKMRNNLISFF